MDHRRDMCETRRLRVAIARCLRTRVVLLGIGNRARGDDAFGPAVIDLVSRRTKIPSIDGGTAPENYLHLIASHRPQVVLCIDAADLGREPGQLVLRGASDIEAGGISTHAGSVALLADYLSMAAGAECRFVLAQRGDLHRATATAAWPGEPGGAASLSQLSPPLRTSAARLAGLILMPSSSNISCEVARA